MSYYQGDYYSGDPGFLSGLGKVFGGIASFIPGVGGVVGKAISAISGGAKKTVVAMAKHPTVSAAGAAATGAVVGEGMHRMLTPSAAGAGMGAVNGRMHPAAAAGGRGYHMSKPRKCGGVIIPPHLVRNRRMRVTNPRALRRAIRRAHGFARLARKVMSFTSARGARGRAHFRARRRRK